MLQLTRVESACWTRQISKLLSSQLVFRSKLKISDKTRFHSSVFKGQRIISSQAYAVNEAPTLNARASVLLSATSATSLVPVVSGTGRSSCRSVFSCHHNSIIQTPFLRTLISKPGRDTVCEKNTDSRLRGANKKSFSLSPTFSFSRFCSSSTPADSTGQFESSSMELHDVVNVLKKMANPSLAGSWDNVGLLLEPTPPHSVSKLLLTNDLTPAVMQEAVDQGVDMIVSYHPPIFAPLKRVTQSSWKERIAGMCLERRIALYSPHTSWDAVTGGVNDWLISAFDMKEVRPIEQTEETVAGRNKKLTFRTAAASANAVSMLDIVRQNPNTQLYAEPVVGEAGNSQTSTRVCIYCSASTLPSILAALEQQHICMENIECCDLAKLPSLGYGMGRVGQLKSPVSVETAVSAIKSHLNLQHVRLAQAADTGEIKTVAVCAGSGSGVLRGVKADLYLTGEMSHHEVLDAVCKGTHVVLCDHSNTERGFLKVIQGRLMEKLVQKVQVIVSERDRDPLLIV